MIERECDVVCDGMEPKEIVGESESALEVALDVALVVTEFVFEEDAPTDNEDVGVCDIIIDCDKECVELGVIDDVAVPLIVADDVGVLVAETECVVLPEFEWLAGVFEGLDPRLIDADDEKEIDEVSVTVEEAVSDEVPVPEFVALAVGVTDCVFKALIVEDGVVETTKVVAETPR